MLETGLAFDALEDAIWNRLDRDPDGLIRHSDHGSQYLSIRCTERLAGTGIEPSTGCVGDNPATALVESFNGLYKWELIYPKGPWTGLADVEYATLEWVDWFNHHRIFQPIRHIPPAEYEANYYRQNNPAGNAGLKQNRGLRQTRTGSLVGRAPSRDRMPRALDVALPTVRPRRVSTLS